MWPIVPVAGRLPAEHRDCGDSGTVRLSGAHVGVSRPRCRWQLCGWRRPTTPSREPHELSDLLGNPLAATGPEAASAACHYPVRANPHPQRRPGSDRRQALPEPHPNPRRPGNARGASRRPRAFPPVCAARKAGAVSAPSAGARWPRPCARPRRLGPTLAKPTAWGAPGPLRPQPPVVPPVWTGPERLRRGGAPRVRKSVMAPPWERVRRPARTRLRERLKSA